MSEVVPPQVAVIGMNALGTRLATAVTRDSGLRLAALVDVAAAGRSAADYDVSTSADVAVLDDVERLNAIDVALVAAGPHLDRLAPTLRQLMQKKTHVVSSCAEMTWPWLRHPHLSDILGGEARRAGVCLIGTGGEAGLTLLAAPLAMLATVSDVRRIHVRRVADAAPRDAAGRLAIGAGLTAAKFAELLKADRLGRLGVGEAVVVLAQAIDRHPMRGDIVVRVEPIKHNGAPFVTGLRSVGTFIAGELNITVEFTVASGVADAGDQITIEGGRTVTATITGDADKGADQVAAMLRAVHATSRLPAGLRTILDLPSIRLG